MFGEDKIQNVRVSFTSLLLSPSLILSLIQLNTTPLLPLQAHDPWVWTTSANGLVSRILCAPSLLIRRSHRPVSYGQTMSNTLFSSAFQYLLVTEVWAWLQNITSTCGFVTSTVNAKNTKKPIYSCDNLTRGYRSLYIVPVRCGAWVQNSTHGYGYKILPNRQFVAGRVFTQLTLYLACCYL